MNDVVNRNLAVRKFVSERIAKAKKVRLSEADQNRLTKELSILSDLIPIPQNGFRGVVLTAIVGQELLPGYDPLKKFYDCSPRAIFENGIFYALQDARIPCGKSDPLNVAKNIQTLDYGWAEGRRPESAARAAVDYLTLLQQAHKAKDKSRYDELVKLYFLKLVEYGQKVADSNADAYFDITATPLLFAKKLAKFVLECPEGGAVPQFILGHLIKLVRKNDLRIQSVEGADESVFGTNTTAKKPADIWEVTTDGQIGALYEITVKEIDHKRIDDCAESLRALGIKEGVVNYICNLANNVSSLTLINDTMSHKGIGFQFIDLRSFLEVTYCLLDAGQQAELFETIQEFVSETNRSIKTKTYWKKNFA